MNAPRGWGGGGARSECSAGGTPWGVGAKAPRGGRERRLNWERPSVFTFSCENSCHGSGGSDLHSD